MVDLSSSLFKRLPCILANLPYHGNQVHAPGLQGCPWRQLRSKIRLANCPCKTLVDLDYEPGLFLFHTLFILVSFPHEIFSSPVFNTWSASDLDIKVLAVTMVRDGDCFKGNLDSVRLRRDSSISSAISSELQMANISRESWCLLGLSR